MAEPIPPDKQVDRQERVSLGCLFLALVFVAVGVVSFVRKRGTGEAIGWLQSAWELFVTEPLSCIGEPGYWLGHPVGLMYSAILWIVVLEGCGRLSQVALGGMESGFTAIGERIAGKLGLSNGNRLLFVAGFMLVSIMLVTTTVILIIATTIVVATDTTDNEQESAEPVIVDYGTPEELEFREQLLDVVSFGHKVLEDPEVASEKLQELLNYTSILQPDEDLEKKLRQEIRETRAMLADAALYYEELEENLRQKKREPGSLAVAPISRDDVWRSELGTQLSRIRHLSAVPPREGEIGAIETEAEQTNDNSKYEPYPMVSIVFLCFLLTLVWLNLNRGKL